MARPILFSGPMVRALLNGRKTQTRRVVKPQPTLPTDEWSADAGGSGRWIGIGPSEATGGTRQTWGWAPCPYGATGDLLWVREAIQRFDKGTCDQNVWYRAGGNGGLDEHGVWNIPDGVDPHQPWPVDRKGPGGGAAYNVASIHMPRWASRLTLEITDVRVERLQAISEADAIAEGIQRWPDGRFAEDDHDPDPNRLAATSAVVAYELLWTDINGPGSWAANPWVWALTFRVHRANVAAVLAERGL